MDYPNLTSFIKSEGRSLAKGPIALLFIEDDVEVETTLDHHIKLGFKQIIVLAKSLPDVDEGHSDTSHHRRCRYIRG